MKIKNFLLIAALGTLAATEAQAQTIAGVSVSNMKLERNKNFMAAKMTLNLDNVDVKSTRALLLTPAIVTDKDTVELSSVGVYGRRRYYYYLRNGETMITGDKEMSYRSKDCPTEINWSDVVPYEEWMNGSDLVLLTQTYGCCNDILDEGATSALTHYPLVLPMPPLHYINPQVETVKSRSISGSAFVDYRVNKTNIDPSYRNNQVELGKIMASIDSVKSDKDINITSVFIKGFASPEGTYKNNTRLADGRTKSLSKHVQSLYHFEDGFITTAYEPENWEGLRAYVEASAISNREGILQIIDSNLEPDKREAQLRKKFPTEYLSLAANCYPALRRSDYRIEYVIRSYSDVKEIAEVFKTSPQKLSLNELHMLAQAHQGEAEFLNDIYETAVRMYPNDQVANLNAANAAMERKDLQSARRYLEKAGNTPEATYARGTYHILTMEYDKAYELMQQAEAAGVKNATEVIKMLDETVR